MSRTLCASRTLVFAAFVGSVLSSHAAGAQGTLSVQGFGYSPAQLSARALGTDGGLGEGDPFSPINPASPGGFGSKILSIQIQPEYRVVSSASGNKRSNIARYPVMFAAMTVGTHLVMSISTSTLLDRTWSTAEVQTVVFGTDSAESVSKHSATGGINDVRFATSWTNRSWLHAGIGVHAITGRNTVSLSRVFPDSSSFTSLAERVDLSISGVAASAGIDLIVPKKAMLSASYRYGGRVHVNNTDSLYSAADVPDRLGVGFQYLSIPGTILALSASHQNWSSLEALGSTASRPVDGWDVSVGGDALGPRVFGQPVTLRGGLRSRTLPFQAAGNTVKEKSAAVGTGFALAGGRVFFDLAAIRSIRDANLDVKERAWTFSFGITTRP